MRHFASPAFWQAYEKLPASVRALADKNYALLKENPQHPSLHFKKVGRFWSVRVGLRYRALAVEADDALEAWAAQVDAARDGQAGETVDRRHEAALRESAALTD